MRNIIQSPRNVFTAALLALVLSSCSTWHYNHPRVQIDPQDREQPQIEQSQLPQDGNVTPTTAALIDEESVTPEVNNVVATNEEASIEKSNPVVEKRNRNIEKASGKSTVKKEKKGFSFFTDKIFKNNQLFKVKEIEKSSVTGWVRLMIILFVVGFILCLIGIFLSVFLHPGFWWLFSFFGGLCILAGFIVLILGLVGVML